MLTILDLASCTKLLQTILQWAMDFLSVDNVMTMNTVQQAVSTRFPAYEATSTKLKDFTVIT